jgi:hypothetical protein
MGIVGNIYIIKSEKLTDGIMIVMIFRFHTRDRGFAGQETGVWNCRTVV